jgi:hypothetical protein
MVAMFQALSNYLIPGLNKAIKILLLSQVEAESELEKGDQNALSSLDFVVKGDKDKALIKEQHDRMSCRMIPPYENLMNRFNTGLDTLLLNQEVKAIHIHLIEFLLRDAEVELKDALDIAARRSGARGKAARAEALKKEEAVEILKKRYVEPLRQIISASVLIRFVTVSLEAVDSGSPGPDELTEVQVMDEALALLTQLQLDLETVSQSLRFQGISVNGI